MSQLFKTGIVISSGNSTSIPLSADGYFIGSMDDVTSYEEIDINIYGDPIDAPGSLYFEFSPDGIHWDVSIWIGEKEAAISTIGPQHLRVILPFFRVKYYNGSTPQTEFRLTTVYHRTSGTRLTRYLNQTVDNTEGVELTRSIIDGYRSDGTYGNLVASSDNHLIVDGYIQNYPSQQHVIVDGYVETNPNVIATGHVSIDGYVQTNPNVNIINTPTVNQGTNPWTSDVTDRSGRLLGHVSVDGYVQTNPNVNVSGSVTSIQGTIPLQTTFYDDAHLDAFQRLRVAPPQTLFDSKQLVDNQPLFWDDQQISGSGTSSTYNTNQASSTLAVSASTAGTRVRQTFQRYNYQPGKSLGIFMTVILGSGSSGITKRIGYFDGYNGLFFQLSGTTLGVGLRTKTSGSPVDTIINQSSWNVDTLDGYGPSGFVLDVTKTQIFIIDFQWLGVGRVRFGFDIGGKIQYCHYINNANTNPLVYMSVPNLPLRYEISNNGSGVASNLTHICTTVISEGGRSATGPVFSIDNGATALTTLNNSNIYPLLALRLKSAYQMAQIDPIAVNIINTSADTFRFCLLLNPTVTGTALSFNSVSNSAVEYASPTNATTVSGGQQIISSYALGSGNGASATSNPINANIASDLRLGSNIAGVSDILVLGVQRVSGTTVSFYGSMSWRESI